MTDDDAVIALFQALEALPQCIRLSGYAPGVARAGSVAKGTNGTMAVINAWTGAVVVVRRFPGATGLFQAGHEQLALALTTPVLGFPGYPAGQMDTSTLLTPVEGKELLQAWTLQARALGAMPCPSLDTQEPTEASSAAVGD